MNGGAERWRRVLAIARVAEGDTPGPSALCEVCVKVLGVAGVGITLMDPKAAVAGYASDAVTRRLDELQFGLGEGPSVDAYSSGVAVLGLDLAGDRTGRWVGFCPPAVAAGIGSVLSFPLQVGAARVGVLTIYRAEPGMITEVLYTDLIVIGEMITRLILAWQAQAPEGMLAAELSQDDVYLAVVHQASGMISVQLDVPVGVALVLLRARSFATSRTVARVAADVVARRTRFGE
jgi:hypothetical protein